MLIEKIKNILILFSEANLMNSSNNVNKGSVPNKQQYKASRESIILFQEKALKLFQEHLIYNEPDLKDIIVNELLTLLKYTFLIIEDDFYLGDKILKNKMTKIDDYLFSQYNKRIALKKNIYELIYISKNKNFSNNPKENILSYYVLAEECNFEITFLLEDFYYLLEMSEESPMSIVEFSQNYDLKNYAGTSEFKALRNTQMPTFYTNGNVTQLSGCS